jgi:hypothetical protein
MAETRRMHYVPRTYLKYFAQERSGEFYIHALTKESGNIFTPNITNICLENDLYMLAGNTEAERQLLENMYHELDTSRKLCHFFRVFKPNLSGQTVPVPH